MVVGTPGRILDHLRRGTLRLGGLAAVVLDEADEMLRMGFIEDVETILGPTPEQRQTALFSATMPREIRRVAQRYLRDPVEIRIESRTTTVEAIRQRYWQVRSLHKLDALTRILEGEEFDAMLVFVRTRTETTALAEKLEARGYDAAPLNGDMQQAERERTVDRLRQGRLDILVATDVAARGLDVSRITLPTPASPTWCFKSPCKRQRKPYPASARTRWLPDLTRWPAWFERPLLRPQDRMWLS